MFFTLDYHLTILHFKFAEHCRFQLEYLPGCAKCRGKILKTSHSHLHGAEKIQIRFLVLHLITCTVITEICVFIASLRQHRRNFQCKIVEKIGKNMEEMLCCGVRRHLFIWNISNLDVRRLQCLNEAVV